MKRFAIKAAVDIVWMLAIIFCASVFVHSIMSFVLAMGIVLVAKWIADAVLAKMLPPKKQLKVIGQYTEELPPTTPPTSQF